MQIFRRVITPKTTRRLRCPVLLWLTCLGAGLAAQTENVTKELQLTKWSGAINVPDPVAVAVGDEEDDALAVADEDGEPVAVADPELLADLFNTQATTGPQGARGAQGGVGRQGPRGPSAADIVVGLPIPSLEDGTARLSSLYYSTEQHSLVYKHSDGVLFRLAMTAISSP